MTATSPYPVTVDGVSLHTMAWSVETKEGRDQPAQLKTNNIDVEAVNGVVWVPNKKYGPGTVILKMWVAGQDANGVVGADNYLLYRQNLDKLNLLFRKQHALLDVRQQLDKAGTVIRQALCEQSAVIQPTKVATSPYTSKFTVELTIPDSFWQDVVDQNYDSGLAVTNNSLHTLTAFDGATAEMLDLYVVVNGPAAVGTKVIDETSGHYVILNRVLGSTEAWVINTTEWSSKAGVGIEFTLGGSDVYSLTTYAGNHNPYIFGLTPRVAGPPQVRIQGTGFGANTRLRIRGKRKFL